MSTAPYTVYFRQGPTDSSQTQGRTIQGFRMPRTGRIRNNSKVPSSTFSMEQESSFTQGETRDRARLAQRWRYTR